METFFALKKVIGNTIFNLKNVNRDTNFKLKNGTLNAVLKKNKKIIYFKIGILRIGIPNIVFKIENNIPNTNFKF